LSGAIKRREAIRRIRRDNGLRREHLQDGPKLPAELLLKNTEQSFRAAFAEALQRANRELEEFAYVSSHPASPMIAAVASYAG
jgi:hypothetical protein